VKNQWNAIPNSLKEIASFVLILAAASLTGCSSALANPEHIVRGDDETTRQYVAKLIQYEMKKHDVTGLSIALVDDQHAGECCGANRQEQFRHEQVGGAVNASLMLTVIATVILGGCNGTRSTGNEPNPQSPPIAFAACDANGVSQIVLAEPDGGNQRVLTQGRNPSWFPAWSPNGTRLLFAGELAGEGGIPQLWIMNADGSEARVLIAGGMSLAGSWSPDGKRIAYAYRADSAQGGLKIWIARADGSRARRLTDVSDPRVDENVPRWAPDGTRVTFTSNLRGRYEIWVVDVASGVARPLTQSRFDPVLRADIEQKVPAWSPDGRFIAYWSGVEATDPRPNLPRDVWVMNSDGTNQRRLVGGDDPNWSPSGEFIIHSTGSNGRPALGVVRPDGSGARILFTVNACRSLQSSWSDGQ